MMPTRSLLPLLALAAGLAIASPAFAQVTITAKADQVTVDIDGKPFSVFHTGGPTLNRVYLHPLRAATGTVVNRSFPAGQVPGETVDHPHHARVGGGQPVRDLAGPVPGAVVHGDDLEDLRDGRQRLEGLLHEGLDVGLLVVGREEVGQPGDPGRGDGGGIGHGVVSTGPDGRDCGSGRSNLWIVGCRPAPCTGQPDGAAP